MNNNEKEENNTIEKDLNNIYETLLKEEENIIRKLYSDLMHEKVLKEILEEKILILSKIQKDYELIKEKTGVIVWDGKIITDGRKDNEINILRKENSTLKNVIYQKEKEIKELNNELKKYKNKNNNLIIPNFSQNDFTINNNYCSTARNFYKSYKIQTKLLNKYKNDKTIDKNSISNNINISSKNSDITKNDKKISVNKNKFNNNNKIKFSRNKYIKELNFNKNYESCENILNKNKIKTKKTINKTKMFYPMREFNSVRYINTQFNSNKENVSSNEIINNKTKSKKKLGFEKVINK
jgi:hypothetical protein